MTSTQNQSINYIQHRVNSASAIATLSQAYGCEIDIRYHEQKLVLWHDPLHHPTHQPEEFEIWLQQYSQHANQTAPLILNIKTEGIEQHCIDLMQQYDIQNYFFLDLSMPYFVKYARLAKSGEIPGFTPKHLAVRFSEFEAIEYALAFKGMAEWVWVDCFTHLPLNQQALSQFKQAGLKTCLVSPELQGHALTQINTFAEQMTALSYCPNAICTKRPDLWQATGLGQA